MLNRVGDGTFPIFSSEAIAVLMKLTGKKLGLALQLAVLWIIPMHRGALLERITRKTRNFVAPILQMDETAAIGDGFLQIIVSMVTVHFN